MLKDMRPLPKVQPIYHLMMKAIRHNSRLFLPIERVLITRLSLQVVYNSKDMEAIRNLYRKIEISRLCEDNEL